MITATYAIAGNELVLQLQPHGQRLLPALRDLAFVEQAGCWSRRFTVTDPAAAARIAENFCRQAESIVLQTAGLQPVPWATALTALLVRLDSTSVNWWLTGSAALAVRGITVTPRDIDLVTDAFGAAQLAALLNDCLFEPLTPSHDWIWRSFGRAFLHSRIEWVGDVQPTADQPLPVDFGPAAAARLEIVHWNGFPVRVPPLALQLAVSTRRGLTARAELIRQAVER